MRGKAEQERRLAGYRDRIRELNGDLDRAIRGGERWKQRANEAEARVLALEQANATLVDQVTSLVRTVQSAAIARDASAPAIVEAVGRAINPAPTVSNATDTAERQQAGVSWTANGLDNGVGATPADLPDVVLGIEDLDPATVSRSGWWNPPQTDRVE